MALYYWCGQKEKRMRRSGSSRVETIPVIEQATHPIIIIKALGVPSQHPVTPTSIIIPARIHNSCFWRTNQSTADMQKSSPLPILNDRRVRRLPDLTIPIVRARKRQVTSGSVVNHAECWGSSAVACLEIVHISIHIHVLIFSVSIHQSHFCPVFCRYFL